jgi:bifunctional non-homologous end joining protein LigD
MYFVEEAAVGFFSFRHISKLRPSYDSRARAPFSDHDWIFEIKWDGFRSLVCVLESGCRLRSRNRNTFKSFPALSEAIPAELGTRSAILDGEIVCLDESGKAQFEDLLFRRGEPRFCAFDVLWVDGEDLHYMPLIERKWRLRSLLPRDGTHLLYCDHIEHDGEKLFRLACEHDMEGIVKQKYAPYVPDVVQDSEFRLQPVGRT